VAIPARVYRLSVFCWFEAASDESTTFLQSSFHFVDDGDTMIDMMRSLLKNKPLTQQLETLTYTRTKHTTNRSE